MTAACRDCDPLPRVPGAGEVFTHQGVKLQRMHNGLLVLADGYCGPWLTEIVRATRGFHEPQEEWAFHCVLNALREPSLIVELGAWWSYYSLWFLQRFPEADALLVEPDPNHLEIGRANFRLNGREGRFIQATVGAISTDPAPFHCESTGTASPVPCVSVDDLSARHAPGRVIDLLLADVQGAETALLQGLAQVRAAGLLRYLFLSTHTQGISGDYRTHRRCLAALQELGAHIVTEHTVEESYSGDGLIVASFDPAPRLDVKVSFNRHQDSLFGSSEDRIADVCEALEACRQKSADTP
jgi:FkbM family methyltransferase